MESRRRAPSRGSYHHGDLRHALLDASLKLIGKRGVEAFSLREAARAVGVSPAAAYRHFEDRSAVLSALAVQGLARLAGSMEEAIAAAPGAPGTPARAVAELAAIGAAYVEFAVAHPSHFRVMFGPWCDHPDLVELPTEVFPRGRDPFGVLVDTLDGLARAGAIAPAARQGAEIAAWAGVHGLSSLLVEGSLRLTREERAGAFGVLMRTLLLGMGGDPALLGASAPVPQLLLPAPGGDLRPEKRRRKAASGRKA